MLKILLVYAPPSLTGLSEPSAIVAYSLTTQPILHLLFKWARHATFSDRGSHRFYSDTASDYIYFRADTYYAKFVFIYANRKDGIQPTRFATKEDCGHRYAHCLTLPKSSVDFDTQEEVLLEHPLHITCLAIRFTTPEFTQLMFLRLITLLEGRVGKEVVSSPTGLPPNVSRLSVLSFTMISQRNMAGTGFGVTETYLRPRSSFSDKTSKPAMLHLLLNRASVVSIHLP